MSMASNHQLGTTILKQETFGLILVFCLNSSTITNIFGLTLFLATHPNIFQSFLCAS